MVLQFPICLVGENMGERHRYLNELVAQHKHDSFDKIKKLPEKTALDRLFKIDLAVKTQNVEYILENLKDEDMLYVSRSLKAKWLLDGKYENIINPAYLEHVLYPEMITTAVGKMKHWINLNLNDEKRSEKFFTFYYDKNRKHALKFLPKCSEDFIKNEFPKIVKEITPHLLKLLCEKTPIAAKMFFEAIQNDKSIATIYDKNANQFFNSIKCLLKLESEIYLDILEHHFRKCWFNLLSPAATQYILSQRKDRFWKKPELYTSWFLDVNTVAKNLTAEECENLVLLFARCKFLEFWFDYKTVEPFIKRLNVTKRAEFKKRVFVRKDVGDEIKEWPYSLPKTYPTDDDRSSVVDDNEEDENIRPCAAYSSYGCHMVTEQLMMADCGFKSACKPKTELDKLFDLYRFKNFNDTLYELRKKIKSISSSQSRMYTFLVLISKSGGKTEHLQELFELLLKYSNEQPQVRAAVVRSLVKRASIWRVDDDLWRQMLTYGHGLGLDGSQSEVDCHEGLHAVIIRNILAGIECSPAVKKAYLHINNFSTLKDYNLTGAEKVTLIDGLQKMLLSVVYEDTDLTAMQYLLDILDDHKIRTDSSVIEAVKHYVSKDMNVSILKRLYDSKIGRKELHSYNFDKFANGAACVNALKHDTRVLTPKKLVEILKYHKLDHFFGKLSIYFSESEGLGDIFLRALMKEKPEKKYARPIVQLIGDELKSYMILIDGQTDDSKIKRYAADVRANAHLARPKIGLDSLEWKTAGVKFLANIIIVCKTVDINKNIEKLVTWKRSVKLAVIIAQRIGKEHDFYPILVKVRPTVAFKYGLMHLKQQGSSADIRIWEALKPLITQLETSFLTHPHLQLKARQISKIPVEYRPQYIVLFYPILKKLKKIHYCLPFLRHTKRLLPKIDVNFVENTLINFFTNEFKVAKLWSYGFEQVDYEYSTLHLDILGKFMLLCKDANALDRRFENVASLFLRKLEPHLVAGAEGTQEAHSNFETFVKYLMYQDEDENYVSCTPVLEKIVKWMQDVMPMERNFNYYVQTHVSMLLHKAKRQCLKQFPDMFAEKKQLNKEAAEILGEIFGRYIAHDANELKSRYYDSIIELYGKSLNSYLYEYNRECTSNISLGIIKGILQEGKGSERRLAVHLYLNDRGIISNGEDMQKAEKMIKECHDNETYYLYNSKLIEYSFIEV